MLSWEGVMFLLPSLLAQILDGGEVPLSSGVFAVLEVNCGFTLLSQAQHLSVPAPKVYKLPLAPCCS